MIADGKARIASRNPDFIERTVLPVNRAFYKQAIKQWGKRLHQKRWERETTCRQTRMMLPKVDGKAWKILQNMNRRNVMFATQIITGHNQLQRHLHIMFQDEPPGCPRCNLEPETSEHVIKNCPAYKDIRRRVLGEYFLQAKMSDYNLKKVMRFVSETKRLDFDF